MRNTSLILFSIAALTCSDLAAWQRQSKIDCQNKKKACEQAVDNCEKQISKRDESNFAASLNSVNRAKFYKFTPEQKKRAMNAADNNRMTPNEAVSKI